MFNQESYKLLSVTISRICLKDVTMVHSQSLNVVNILIRWRILPKPRKCLKQRLHILKKIKNRT